MEKDEIKVKGVFDPIQILKRIQKLSNKKTDLVSPKVQEIKVKDTPKADKNAKETKQVTTLPSSSSYINYFLISIIINIYFFLFNLKYSRIYGK